MKRIFSFNAKTAKECLENFSKTFFEKKEEIVGVYSDINYVSPTYNPLDYPLVIETENYFFCLHNFEKNLTIKDISCY